MREIKFRAWDKIHKKIRVVKAIEFGVGVSLENDDMGDIDGYVIMQYTGLLDKNSKEVFEGDLLGGTWGDGYIGYCDKCKSFEYFGTVFGCMACEGDVTWRELVENDGKLEVIGNIYESSNLLDTKT